MAGHVEGGRPGTGQLKRTAGNARQPECAAGSTGQPGRTAGSSAGLRDGLEGGRRLGGVNLQDLAVVGLARGRQDLLVYRPPPVRVDGDDFDAEVVIVGQLLAAWAAAVPLPPQRP